MLMSSSMVVVSNTAVVDANPTTGGLFVLFLRGLR